MGIKYMSVRWLLTVVSIFIMALIVDKLIKREELSVKNDLIAIDHSVCILCGKCLKEYPDQIILIDGKYNLRNNDIPDDIKIICPVGAIK